MLDVIFVILYLTIPPLVCYLLKVAKYPIDVISIPSVFICFYFLFSYIGIPALYFQWNELKCSYYSIDNKDLLLKLFLMSAFNLIAVTFGILLIARKKNFCRFYRQYIPTFYYKAFIFLLVVVSVYAVINYLSKVPSITLFVSLFGGEESSAVARSNMTNNFSGKLHWYKLFYKDILPFCALMLYSRYLQEKKGLFFFVAMLIIALFGLLMTGEKGPPAMFLLMLWCMFVIERQNRKISIRSLLVVGVVVIIFTACLYILFMGAGDIIAGFQSLFGRAFTGQIDPAYHYLRVFPNIEPYLFGGSFPNPGGVLPFTPFPLTRIMAYYFYPHLEEGVVASVPTVYWAEMYANFGVFGALLSSVFLGMLLSFCDIRISTWPHKSATIAFYVWLMFYFNSLSGTGLFSLFSPERIVPLILILFTFTKIKGMYRQKILLKEQF